ncbi:MAG TPA: glycosyltransferase family 2 protein [Anaerolineae bacterium]|nr:glycosyltransferase family 2 protein [Anaerolineae bacterium]HOQ98994.1 glycosyltransferase family 2 protein [Anaerolineae bacterium]HPL29034.1 glycosyltransferase family 2 protein [Anaerolineae bacterium]
MALLGIVTVSYNVRELLRQCLSSVQESLARAPLQAEVIVVDNASADGSAAMVRDEFPWVRLLVNERNAGFAAANNLGLRALGFPDAAGAPPYAMLLNPDTIVHGAALAELVAFMERAPRAGACGARLVYGDGTFQHSAFRFPTVAMAWLDFFPMHHRLLDSRLNGRYPRRLYERGEPFAIDHPLGAALLVRREAAAQVGLLDERFFMYCEEIDWCRRIKDAGWAIACVPQAEIAHLAGQSTRQFRDDMLVALWRSRYQLFARHNGRLYRWTVRAVVAAGLAREAARVRRQVRAGALDPDAAERRLRAYATVRALGRAAV